MEIKTETLLNKNEYSIFHNIYCMDCGYFLGIKEGKRTIKDTFELCKECLTNRLKN